MQGLGDVDRNKGARRGIQGLGMLVCIRGREMDTGVGGCRCV